jgi:hypothetical protein
MKQHALVAGLFAAMSLMAPEAKAALVLNFTTIGDVTATNPTPTTTEITGTNMVSNVGFAPLGVVFVNPELFDLNATSTSPANVTAGGNIEQHFSGSFCVSVGAFCLPGTRLLYGNFQDAVVGSGASLTLSASDNGGAPGEFVDLFSDNPQMTAHLGGVEAVSFAFVDVSPLAHVTSGTLAPFTANVVGNVSANPIPIPGAAMLFGSGLAGLMFLTRKRKGQTRRSDETDSAEVVSGF